MTSWLREVDPDEIVIDRLDRSCLITQDEFLKIDAYETTVPTAPSAGRVYRRSRKILKITEESGKLKPGIYLIPCKFEDATEHWLYVVEDAAPSDPRGGQLHHPLRAIIV